MYDIAIIGAGPAGSTLARLLSTKYKVLILDKRQLDKKPSQDKLVKCCGGLVAPDAQKVLAELGLGLPQDVLVGPQLFVVRTIDLKQSIERFYQRFYINIDREKFDRWLLSLVSNNVDIMMGTSLKSARKASTHSGYELEVIQGDRVEQYSCRILVGADGASSLVRRQLCSEASWPNKYVAIQEWFEVDKTLPYFTALFHPDVTDYYAWTIPKQQHLLLGAALHPGKNASKEYLLLKNMLASFDIKLGKPVKREGSLILRPQYLGQLCLGRQNVALIGEAAGWISPSSAEGFSYAMRSAQILAECLLEDITGFMQRYKYHTKSLKLNIWIKNRKAIGMYQPLVRNMVMKSGLASVQVKQGEG